ncbi:MAG TPA: hypothetical protein VFJ12_09035, partial [Segeticoccus sp.]|nr:hypothetical protein [Segeticoccus sp.]
MIFPEQRFHAAAEGPDHLVVVGPFVLSAAVSGTGWDASLRRRRRARVERLQLAVLEAVDLDRGLAR